MIPTVGIFGSSSVGESHPNALTVPDVSLSTHPGFINYDILNSLPLSQLHKTSNKLKLRFREPPGAQPAGEEVEKSQDQDDGGPGRKVDGVGQDQAPHRGTESQYIM